MKILKLEECKNKDYMKINSIVGNSEIRQLNGYLNGLVLFATNTIDIPTKAIKTGARHSYARYLLLPVKLRRTFRTNTHDFDNIKCGALKYKDDLFVVFSLKNKLRGHR